MSAGAKVWVRTAADYRARGNMLKMKRIVGFLCAVLCSVAGLSFGDAVEDRLQRGQALHDTICRGCHEDTMYTQRHLSRNPYFDLRMQTRLWSEVVKVKWNDEEIDDDLHENDDDDHLPEPDDSDDVEYAIGADGRGRKRGRSHKKKKK